MSENVKNNGELRVAGDFAASFSSMRLSDEASKQVKCWQKTLTPSQKKRREALMKKSMDSMNQHAIQLAKAMPNKAFSKNIMSAINSIQNKEALSFFVLDLEYGVIGSMPPVPVKVKMTKAVGQTVKVGYLDGKPRSGIVVEAESKPHFQMKAFDTESKMMFDVDSPEQIIAIGESQVQTTWVQDNSEHPFHAIASNRSAPTM